jgi:hypothetical protein
MLKNNRTKCAFAAVLMVAFLCTTQIVFAQQKGLVNKLSDTAWVQMMENPNVNYLEAVENFENYWKNKRKPKEESEVFEEAEEPKKEEKEEKFTDPNEPAVKYFFEYKKFKQWQQDVAPYLQPDGTILQMDDRIKIWKRQQEIIKQQKVKKAAN